MFKGISIYDFRNQFKTENDCFSYLFDLKWGNGYQCSKCKHDKFCKGRTKWYLSVNSAHVDHVIPLHRDQSF